MLGSLPLEYPIDPYDPWFRFRSLLDLAYQWSFDL